MSDTPRTDLVNSYIRSRHDFTKSDHQVWMEHGIDLERELNAAKKRIAWLENAGARMQQQAGLNRALRAESKRTDV